MSNSKSTFQKVFCLEGLWLDRVEPKEHFIDLYVRKTTKTARCPLCQKPSSRVHKTTRRTLKHMFCDDKVVRLKLTIRSFKCTCAEVRTFRESIQGIDRRRTTAHFRFSLVPKVRDRSFSSVARETSLSASSVARTAAAVMKAAAVTWPQEPFALGLDGHSFSGHDMMVTVTDVTHHDLLTILPDDRQTTVKRFLKEISEIIKEKITCVCMDMDQGLRGAVHATLPHTSLVVDKFHVIQHFNEHLSDVRTLYTSSSFLLPKKLLEKNREDLNEHERKMLGKIFDRYPPVAEFWRMKEIMRSIYRIKSPSEARRRFESLLDGLEFDHRPRWQKLYRTLTSWKEDILNYFIYKETNAYTEGVHTRIKLLKRISYGFRNRTNYIAKMTIAFLPATVLLDLIQRAEASPCLT